MEWTRTRSVLVELGNLLTCAICKSYLKDPCTLDNCDHNFCRKCIEETLGSESKCPECGLFSWVKDLRLNHQLATTVNMTLELQSLIGVNMEVEDSEPRVQGDSESLSGNTFTFSSDKEMPDENCNEEQGLFSGTESVSTIKYGTNTKESDSEGETRQTVNMTQPKTSVIESTGLRKHTRTAQTTTSPGSKQNSSKSGSTRKNKNMAKQPNITVQNTRESDSEASHGSAAAETTTDTTNSKQRGNARNSATKHNKRSKQPSVTFPRRPTDTETDNESNHASAPYVTTESANVNRWNLRKSTRGRGHKKITKQPSVTLRNDTESADSEINDAGIVETTTKSTNDKQHTNVRKRATRRLKKITTQPSVPVQSTRESDSEASHASTTETTTCLKRTNKCKPNRKHNNKTKQASVAVQNGSTGSGTESSGETNHSGSVATTTENTHAKLCSNVKKSTTVTEQLKNTKQRTILNSATDTDSETEANNAGTAATAKARTSIKENLSKSRSNTIRTHKNMTKQRTALSNTAESDSETKEETTKESTNAKQHTNVIKPARAGNKLSKQPTVMNSATDTQSDSKAINASTAEAASTKEDSNMKQRSNVRNLDAFRGGKKMNKPPNITEETSTLEPMETESIHLRDTTETKITKSLHRKKKIVTQEKISSSKRADRKVSGQNIRKTNSNLTGVPFDFTQQEDPFHFSFTEDGDNDSGSDDNDNHDDDDRDYENYDDNDGHDNDEDHENGLHDDDDHSNDDGGNKPSLRSISTKNTLTRGRKTRGEKSNSFGIGHDDVENNKGILQNTRSTNTRLRNKIKRSVTAEHTEKKVQFTHLKDRSSNHDQNDQVRIEKDKKKTSPNGLKHDQKVVGDEDKENVINIKRRRVRGKRYNIRQYLINVDRADTPESSSDDAPAPQKKSRNPSISSQNTRKNITSSQNSQSAGGSSQKTRNKKGETPLHLAAIKGDLALAHELINEGADPNVKDHAGWTPLHEACNHGHVDIVELFLDHDALINIPGLDNDTPLHDAVANGRLKVVKLLVARGAVLTARNKQGLLPMDYNVTKAMKAALAPRDVSSSTKPSENYCNDNVKISSESCRQSQVILGTALKTQDQATLKICVKQLGGTLVDEFDESVTHVVTSVNENSKCPRTIKYLCGILTGKWIVSFEWIKGSLRQRQWLDEDVYEVEGTVGKTCNAARKARLNILQQMPRLLDGCSFFLRGMFNPPTVSKQDLIKLIQLGGGKLLHREPKVRDDDLTSVPSSPIVTSISRAPEVAYHAPAYSTLSCCTEFILYDSVSGDQPKIVYSPVLRTAPVTWLMDCISSFQFLDIPDVEIVYIPDVEM